MSTERILVTVRTYPNLSTKYIETVCTGGINDRGEWRRLYPVPLRHLEDEKQYRTFDVISVRLGSNPDGRPESRRPDSTTLKVVDHLNDWAARCDWILPTALPSLSALEESGRTLAPVAVKEVLEFIANPESSEWCPKQQELLNQAGLFEGPKPLEKLPFDFRLRWSDGDGVEHNSKFLAWEVGETWRKFRNRYPDPIEVMREKWMNDLFGLIRDIWFFMGNFAEHRQHFGVCGAFVPPKEHTNNVSLWSHQES
jgi:hypothetical protein